MGMISTASLSIACGVHPDTFARWAEQVAAGTCYTRTAIPQKRRRPRTVLMPSVSFSRVLKQLRLGLTSQAEYSPPVAVHGFVRGRDIVTNAAQHLDQDVVLKVDLADFFGSIGRDRLTASLELVGFGADCASEVADVTLVDDALAQGFSTSPFLSNISFQRTDAALSKLAARSGVTFTRYVDDMCFSGPREAIHDAFLAQVERLLDSNGWRMNHNKTRFMRRGRPQYVTGLYVGDAARPHIPRSMKKLLRREVYYASRFGARDALERTPTPIPTERLGGWVHYAAHADPVFGKELRRMWTPVASERYRLHAAEAWNQLLAEIHFPESW